MQSLPRTPAHRDFPLTLIHFVQFAEHVVLLQVLFLLEVLLVLNVGLQVSSRRSGAINLRFKGAVVQFPHFFPLLSELLPVLIELVILKLSLGTRLQIYFRLLRLI